jgi:hypothetical protein
MGGLLVIETAKPIIVMHFPVQVDAGDVQGMMAAFDRAHRRGARHAIVLDATHTKRLPRAEDRQVLDAWLQDEERKKKERELTVGTAVVVPSSLVRAFVAAMNFVRKPLAPRYQTASFADGVEWCCARLVDAGVPLSPEAERLRAGVARDGT